MNPDRIIRLIVNGTNHAGESADSIYWRGAAAFAITDLAEASGCRVEIELVFRVAGGYPMKTHTLRIMLKRAQDPVTPDTLAFVLCNASSLRRICFGIQETLPTAIRRKFGFGRNGSLGGYGRPEELPVEERENAIYVPGSLNAFRTAQSTAAWVRDTLREHEIEVVAE